MAIVGSPIVTKVSGGEDKDGPTYEITYYIKTTTKDDGPGRVRDYAGWSYGDTYAYGNETDSRAICVEISEREIGGRGIEWEVTVNFKDPGIERPDNPLSKPPEISWEVEERQQVLHKLPDGTAVLNAARDPFPEPLVEDDFRRKLQVQRNEASFNKAAADVLSNSVNAATWNGYGAKTVKCHPIVARIAYNSFIGDYWEVTYQFSFAEVASEWKRTKLQEGFYELVSNRKVRIKDDDGKPVASPARLNASGVAVSPTSGTSFFAEFETLKTADFGLLNMNTLTLT